MTSRSRQLINVTENRIPSRTADNTSYSLEQSHEWFSRFFSFFSWGQQIMGKIARKEKKGGEKSKESI